MPFPLLSLPINIQQLVLEQMDHVDKISLSFCSKQTKTLVKKLNLQFKLSQLLINELVTLAFNIGSKTESYHSMQRMFLDFTNLLTTTGTEVRIRVPVDNGYPQMWKIRNFGVRDWIDHILDVFSASQIYECRFWGEPTPFETETLQNIVKGLNFECLVTDDPLSDDDFKKIMAVVPNPSRIRLLLNTVQLNDREFMRKVTLQNYQYFDLFDFWPAHFASLDNFLMINASTIQFFRSEFRVADINRFMKLWTRGAMRTLKYLYLLGSPNIITNWNGVLDGIKRVEIPHNKYKRLGIRRRTDGAFATATFRLGVDHERPCFEFYVFK
uniref:F-box domain-containing protein n=1 Tax=Caenorhabditis tropicalis TaxID=1561998 RepID=A0A1I7TH54_9PELO